MTDTVTEQVLPPGYVRDGRLLVLRTCAADGTSRDGNFTWAGVGQVTEAPDWDGGCDCCGGKLHGIPWGESQYGAGGLLDWSASALWQVVEVDLAAGAVAITPGGPKCGFRRGVELYRGAREGAIEMLVAAGAVHAIHGATLTGGHRATLTGGHRATLTGGDYATLTGGDYATLTGGYGATARCEAGGIIALKYEVDGRSRLAVGYAGENGIRAGVWYRVDTQGRFVEAVRE